MWRSVIFCSENSSDTVLYCIEEPSIQRVLDFYKLPHRAPSPTDSGNFSGWDCLLATIRIARNHD